MVRLILLRHAKSDWDADYGSDHDRPLNDRGASAAASIGGLLTTMGQEPDLVVTSSAVRARTTAELAAAAGEWSASIKVTEELYGAGVEQAIELIRHTDPTLQRAVFVGHEPTWSSLVQFITGGSVRMATATAVGIDIGTWSQCGRNSGQIMYVVPPRLLSDR
ncbi:MAG: histidine phosphatase family protein [Acidimicrobiia bacterium]|nr:histidine phosphatase family protein [Acidimicrobiia bacterium]